MTIKDCITIVGKQYGFAPVELLSARRQAPLVKARHVACWLAKYSTASSYPKIAHCLGGRDHTTILHAIKRIEARRAADPAFRAETDALLAKVRQA